MHPNLLFEPPWHRRVSQVARTVQSRPYNTVYWGLSACRCGSDRVV